MEEEHWNQWDQLLELFEDYQHSANMSTKTIANRNECYQLLAKLSGQSPTNITKVDLRHFMARSHHRTGQPLAAGTKASERSYLQVFFRWLNDEGYRDDDPAQTLPKVKIPRRQPRPFNIDQVDAMVTTGAYSRTRDIITIAARTGLRVGEIVKIRGEDVDLQNRHIVSIRKGGFLHGVSIDEEVYELAKQYPRQGWWFPSPYPNREYPDGGGHILMKSASADINRAMRRAGISDARLTGHSLRHFYATMLLRAGVNIRVVQEGLGHASLATTQLYTLVTDEEKLSAVRLLPATARPKRSGRIAA
jgi:integrase/recombinase XerD